MKKGCLNLVLHAHLPFVRHPEYPDFLEEDWLFEAIKETYIPLLQVFEKLFKDGCPFHLTMSITPTLMSMLEDELLQIRFVHYINNIISLCEKEIRRTETKPRLNKCARFYLKHFQEIAIFFTERYKCQLMKGFKFFAKKGCLEIITCPATHGILPLLAIFPEAVNAQLEVGKTNYEKTMGFPPRGIWLAECAYYPGHEVILKKKGIQFFCVDAHGILYAFPRPKNSLFAPICCPSGVYVFGRDMDSSKEVWSAKCGYPGDFNYREFYRDVGFDLDEKYLRPHMHECGIRTNLGIKYHRITGKVALGDKDIYDPDNAMAMAKIHAADFILKRENQIRALSSRLPNIPIITSLYDAELFGHWWFEGPWFLEHLFRTAASGERLIETSTPMLCLEKLSDIQQSTPAASSWGHKGYFEFWLNKTNDWIYKHIFKITQKMILAAREYPQAQGQRKRILTQMAREVLLAQCSDWPFIMRTGTTVEYATKRVNSHISRYLKLEIMLRSGLVNNEELSDIESKDNIFPHLDYQVFAKTS
ncbi:glycoside hydrolase family 57 protein [Candidatus Riflebacteria bacterium]